MIESNFENVIKAYRKVSMTPEEKKEVFNQSLLVIEKIEAVSMSHGDKYSNETGMFAEMQKNKQAFAAQFLSYFKRRQFVPAFIAAFLLLFTGGASLLAESALPGDSLYSFKVNVNEPIKDLSAVSDEAKARVALEITERRLQEAAMLSAQGKLDQSNKKLLQDEVVKRAEQIRNRVASLVSNNNLDAAQEVAVDFESRLKTHELILESLAGENGDPTMVSASIAMVNDATSTNPSTQVPGSPSGVTFSNPTVPAARTTVVAKKPVTEVASLLLTVKSELDSATVARIGVQEKVTAQIAQNGTTTASQAISQSLIESNLKELKFMISDIENNLNTFPYSTSSVTIVKSRIGQASTTLTQLPVMLKNGQLTEAASTTRALLQGLTQIETVLKLEKNTKASLDGKVNIEQLFQDVSWPGMTPNSGAIEPNQSQSSTTTAVSGTIVQ